MQAKVDSLDQYMNICTFTLFGNSKIHPDARLDKNELNRMEDMMLILITTICAAVLINVSILILLSFNPCLLMERFYERIICTLLLASFGFVEAYSIIQACRLESKLYSLDCGRENFSLEASREYRQDMVALNEILLL